jgi:hypothetical protein
MVKLRRMGKLNLGDRLACYYRSYQALRSGNTGFVLGNWIPTTSDFNLTAMIDVDYSLTNWFRNAYGGKFAEKDLVFWENL